MDLAGTVVEFVGDGVQVGLTERAEVGAFGEVLPEQPVGVFVGAALPGATWLAQVDRHAGRGGDGLSSRSSADSDALTPRRLPSSTSAACNQLRRHDSLIPKSLAICVIGASPPRATATMSSRNSFGWGLGTVHVLPVAPLGTTNQMSPIRAADPSEQVVKVSANLWADGVATPRSSVVSVWW